MCQLKNEHFANRVKTMDDIKIQNNNTIIAVQACVVL